MILYMILAERDRIYPECVFVSDEKEKAEKIFNKLAKNKEIKKYGGNKWFFDGIDVYVLTKTILSKTD